MGWSECSVLSTRIKAETSKRARVVLDWSRLANEQRVYCCYSRRLKRMEKPCGSRSCEVVNLKATKSNASLWGETQLGQAP